MADSSIAKRSLTAGFEFVFLFGLWLAFVSNPGHRAEYWAGLAAALIGAIADALVKSKNFAVFRPKLDWVALFFLEPWYAITGTASIFRALLRRIAGKKSEAQLHAIKMDVGGDDPESSARRALMIALMTIPPNLIVVGIDRHEGVMLVHQVSPTGTPWIGKRMGAME